MYPSIATVGCLAPVDHTALPRDSLRQPHNKKVGMQQQEEEY